eukprot:s990_g12.t1
MVTSGIRLVETMSGALICEDWIPHTVIMYAYDCEKSQRVYGNFGYNGLSVSLKNRRAEAQLEWDEHEKQRGQPGFEEFLRFEPTDYCNLKRGLDLEHDFWKDYVILKRPLTYKDFTLHYDVIDDFLPRDKKKPLRMLVCIGRKPTISAAGFSTSPSDARGRRDDRFNQEAFNPSVEGNLTRCSGTPESR